MFERFFSFWKQTEVRHERLHAEKNDCNNQKTFSLIQMVCKLREFSKKRYRRKWICAKFIEENLDMRWLPHKLMSTSLIVFFQEHGRHRIYFDPKNQVLNTNASFGSSNSFTFKQHNKIVAPSINLYLSELEAIQHMNKKYLTCFFEKHFVGEKSLTICLVFKHIQKPKH